jgi:hypothetical protein
MVRTAVRRLTALLWLTPAVASAADGVVEINQQKALAGGVTAADTPGFPVTIGTSGSYVLTSDLVVTDPGQSGIAITGNGVSLDLNGFEIRGPVLCLGLGSLVSCSPPGFASGIDATGVRVMIRDGRVRGFGVSGVSALDRSVIRDVVSEGNARDGFSVGNRAILNGLTAHQNRANGITTGVAAVVERSVASSNAGDGFALGFGNVASGVEAHDNGLIGIRTSAGAVVRDSTATFNEGIGIQPGVGSVVSGITAFTNTVAGVNSFEGTLVADSAAHENVGHGIAAAGGACVHRNTASENTQRGLSLSMGAVYRGNTMSANGVGAVLGGVDMGDNSCNGAVTCP